MKRIHSACKFDFKKKYTSGLGIGKQVGSTKRLKGLENSEFREGNVNIQVNYTKISRHVECPFEIWALGFNWSQTVQQHQLLGPDMD